MRPTLFILCGYPFAGKSTLCRKIINHSDNVVHFCIDEFFEAHPELQDEEERWDVVFQHGRDLSCAALKEGKHVLFDATNYLKKERAKLRRMAEGCGGEATVIYVEIPMEIARQRWMENRATALRKDVTEAAWTEVTGDFETPTMDEHVIVYRWNEDKDAWVQQHFQK
ncbi:MAG: ATP-binding protein [Anaerolineae bacterium]|jgi:predicted kinase|nr:ATP-binding protein [Anaerolineae bacterium]